MNSRPFIPSTPTIEQYARVSHVAAGGTTGVVTAFTQRGDFYTYEVSWDATRSGWYCAEELLVSSSKPAIGFTTEEGSTPCD